MKTDRSKRLLSLISTFALLLTVFFAVVRPWYLRWGATDQELRMPLPGDEIIPNAEGQETRAITIRAPVEQVWPWLAQLGQDRGGFYSYDLLENLVGCEMPTHDFLRPELQAWGIGDRLWMYPANKAGGMGFATLRSHVPGRALGFGTRAVGTPATEPEDGSWSFVLIPTGPASTRLLIRGRGAPGRSLLGVAFDRSIFEPVHFVMERRMMIGVKQLTEGGSRHRLLNHIHVVLWTATFVLFIALGVHVLHRERWAWPMAGFFAAGLLFQLLTLVQPPVIVGTTLLVTLTGVACLPRPTSSFMSGIVRPRRPQEADALV